MPTFQLLYELLIKMHKDAKKEFKEEADSKNIQFPGSEPFLLLSFFCFINIAPLDVTFREEFLVSICTGAQFGYDCVMQYFHWFYEKSVD